MIENNQKVYFELTISEYKNLNIGIDGLDVIHITNFSKIESFSKEIMTLIQYFNDQYTWNNMFVFEDVLKRINDGEHMYLLIYNGVPIGYVFFKFNSTDYSILYNLYVTNIIQRPKESPVWFINEIIPNVLLKFQKIWCYSDGWNTSAQKVFLMNNFRITDPNPMV